MSTMLTLKTIISFMIDYFFNTKSTCTVFAVGHHSWVTGEVEVLNADTTF
jgi:hypothetical protein